MAQTIGERNSANGVKKPCWADLADSSAEDLLDEPNFGTGTQLLNTDSYLDTPDPSFDLPNGSVLCNLGAAIALSRADRDWLPPQQASAAWQPNRAAPEFNPEVASNASSTARHRFLRNKRRVPIVGAFGVDNKRPRQTLSLAAATSAASRPLAMEESRGGAQNSTAVEGPGGGDTEEDWQRRHTKRLNVVQSVKTTPEYGNMSRLRAEGSLGDAAPGTPDAHARIISKRKWEADVMHWRHALRRYTLAAPSSETPAPSTDANL